MLGALAEIVPAHMGTTCFSLTFARRGGKGVETYDPVSEPATG